MSCLMDFPQSMPENCPPADAQDGPKTLYRFVMNAPPIQTDVQTSKEAGTFLDGNECQRHSLSMSATIEGLKRTARKVPRYKHAYVARATIPDGGGKVKHTPSHYNKDHWSWWPPVGFNRCKVLTVT